MLNFIKTKYYSYKFDNETRHWGLKFYLLFNDLGEVRRESQRHEKSLTFNLKVANLGKIISGFIDLKKAFLDYLMYGEKGTCDLDNAIRFSVAYVSIVQGKFFSYSYEQSIGFPSEQLQIDYLMITTDAQRIFKEALNSPNLFQLTEYPKILTLENELAQHFNRIVKDGDVPYMPRFKETSS